MENTASLDASNLRFTIGRITLPMGVGGRSVVIRRPGTSLAVPLLDDDQVVELRQYRIAVATRLLAGLIQSVSQERWPGLAAWAELSGIAPALCRKLLLPQPIST